MKQFFYLILLATIGLSACKSDSKPPKNPDPPKPKPTITVSFDADSAYSYVERQVSFGPRVPGTAAHQQTMVYLKNKLAEFCDTSYIMQGSHQDAAKKTYQVFNIMGRFNASSKKRVLLAAHWDTRPQSDEDLEITDKPADGANDGASGVGVLLEIARQVKALQPDLGIDIIFFDQEDGGTSGGNPDTWCIGSQHWASNALEEGYVAQNGILLDMVGAPNATFALEGHSVQYNQNLLLKTWETGQSLGYGAYFLNIPGGIITDDHVYMASFGGIPTIDIIHYDLNTQNHFPEHWHKQSDNMSAIDKNTLKAVGHTVLHVVINKL